MEKITVQLLIAFQRLQYLFYLLLYMLYTSVNSLNTFENTTHLHSNSEIIDPEHREMMKNLAYDTALKKDVQCTLADNNKLNRKHIKMFLIIKTGSLQDLNIVTNQSQDARFFVSEKTLIKIEYQKLLGKNRKLIEEAKIYQTISIQRKI